MKKTLNLAEALLDAGAVRLSPRAPFTWASGLKAPIYCDNRQLLGYPDLRARVADALAECVAERHPSLVAGTSTAGIPWATLVADRMGLPLAYVRPEPKKHGMNRQVEGPHADGHRVVLLEDLISTGGSSLKCVEALRREDAEVIEVLALFSYELPQGVSTFQDARVPCRVLTTFTELLECARAKGIVDDNDLESLADWRTNTEGWSKRHE